MCPFCKKMASQEEYMSLLTKWTHNNYALFTISR